MASSHSTTLALSGLPSAQRGATLFIALIALVAMSLAGIALVRSVDTGVVIAGNIAFKQSALQEADRGIESAVNAITTGAIADLTVNNSGQNYYATRQPVDARGVPNILTAATPILIPTLTDSRNEVRYVIERLCDATGAATPTNCVMASTGIPAPGGSDGDENLTPPPTTFYRVTVRVDGPRNTTSFAQAMLRL